MLDAKLIAAAIASRTAWERIAPHFGPDDFTPVSKFWYGQVLSWYESDPGATSVDKSLLVERARPHITNSKHTDQLLEFVNDLPDNPSTDNVVQIALEIKRHNIGSELGRAIGAQDQREIARLLPLFTEIQSATSLGTSKVQWQEAVAVEELFNTVGKGNRIPIAPQKLNDRAGGGALPGDHIIIFGRPEEGKSLFAINMAYGFVKQKVHVDYFGNEDHINKLKFRFVARATGMTQAECEAKPKTCAKRFREKGGEDFLRMIQMAHGTMEDISRKVEERPVDGARVIVIDQIRNVEVEGMKGDKLTAKLEILGQQARRMLIEYQAIGASITQANDRTQKHGQEPPIFLQMSDMDSSRTGLPASGDLIVGIAGNAAMKARNQRQVSLPKNKMSSEADSHTGFVVEVDQTLNRVR